MAEPFDVARCEALAVRAAAGDSDARRVLIAELWPAWLEMVRSSRSMGSLARSEDHVRNVATKLVEKIDKGGGHALRLYALWLERHPEKTFLDWIRIITANTVKNYVSAELGPRVPASDGPSPKRVLNEFASSTFLDELGLRPPVTAAQTARELLEFAEVYLPLEQQRALGLWLEGATVEEIGRQLGVGAEEAGRLQRAAVATLRRHFGRKTGAGGAR